MEYYLSDVELRELYPILSADPELTTSHIQAGDTLISMHVFWKTINFRDGYCLCIGLNNVFWVIYHTHKEWNIWEARQGEIDELRQEQRKQLEIDKLLFLAKDDALKNDALRNLEVGEFERAAFLVDQRIKLRKDHEHLREHVSFMWFQILYESILMLSQFPTSEPGIKFLDSQARHWFQYTEFADEYCRCHAAAQEGFPSEIERIHRAAIARFPSDGKLYKRICLFWRRQRDFRRAIAYCQMAIEKHLHDDTTSSFEGRIRRLEKEAKQLPQDR
jgi:tetratricopeptide (TPR) repeat protein